ncbi:Transcription and mRNA export factor SUS1 [Pseudozyma hubeiensis]|nr:Transcription and mRNA export factor SUS1 [Pseudozyma hubeiensis]
MEEGELSSSQHDPLYNALHQRLVASGEWQRLLILLRRMLDESGWETEFDNFATAKAKTQPVLSVPALIDVLTPHAKDTIPPHVKEHLLGKLRDFLDRNLEDA